eukprot:COSAG02_NODE_43200_length_377_cov_0.737410_1_plen_101_part_01
MTLARGSFTLIARSTILVEYVCVFFNEKAAAPADEVKWLLGLRGCLPQKGEDGSHRAPRPPGRGVADVVHQGAAQATAALQWRSVAPAPLPHRCDRARQHH